MHGGSLGWLWSRRRGCMLGWAESRRVLETHWATSTRQREARMNPGIRWITKHKESLQLTLLRAHANGSYWYSPAFLIPVTHKDSRHCKVLSITNRPSPRVYAAWTRSPVHAKHPPSSLSSAFTHISTHLAFKFPVPALWSLSRRRENEPLGSPERLPRSPAHRSYFS